MSEISFSVGGALRGAFEGVHIMDRRTGSPVSDETLKTLLEKCPELDHLDLRSTLFNTKAAGKDGPQQMAARFGCPFLGSIPMDANLTKACEEGEPFNEAYKESVGATAFSRIVSKVRVACGDPEGAD